MAELPDTVNLVRRRGDVDGDWSVVTGPEIQDYAERPTVWEIEELRRVQAADVPADRLALRTAFRNAAAADDASPLLILAAEEWLEAALHDLDQSPTEAAPAAENTNERTSP